MTAYPYLNLKYSRLDCAKSTKNYVKTHHFRQVRHNRPRVIVQKVFSFQQKKSKATTARHSE